MGLSSKGEGKNELDVKLESNRVCQQAALLEALLGSPTSRSFSPSFSMPFIKFGWAKFLSSLIRAVQVA